MTSLERLEKINSDTATPVSTAAGIVMHPDSIANLGPVLVDDGGGIGETAYVAARGALHSMYSALSGMNDAVKENLVQVGDGRNKTMQVPNDRRPALAAAMGQRFESAA